MSFSSYGESVGHDRAATGSRPGLCGGGQLQRAMSKPDTRTHAATLAGARPLFWPPRVMATAPVLHHLHHAEGPQHSISPSILSSFPVISDDERAADVHDAGAEPVGRARSLRALLGGGAHLDHREIADHRLAAEMSSTASTLTSL